MARGKKKKKQTLVLLLIAVVILTAILLLLKNKNNDNDIEEETTDTTMAEIDISKIKEISFKNEYDSFEFVKNADGMWANVKDDSFPLKQAELNSIENSIENINYNLIVSKTPEDLAQYGLDNPLVSALITLDDGSKTQLNIGIKLPVADGYYAMINDDLAVYVINNDLFNVFNKSQSDMLTVEVLPTISADSIGYVKLTNEDKVTLEMKYNENEPAGFSGFNNWQVLQPYEKVMEGNTYTILEYLEKFGTLYFNKCIDYKVDDLAQYGLENPSSIIYLEYVEILEDNDNAEEMPTHVLELQLGNTNEEGDYYARTSDSNSVHILSKGFLTDLVEVDTFALLEKGLTSINIETVDSMEVRSGQKEYLMEIKRDTSTTEEDEVATYYIDNVEVEEEKFKTIYQRIIKARGEKLLEEDYVHNETDEPLLWIIFHRNTKKDKTVDIKYYVYDNSYCAVDINGDMIYITDRRTAEEVIESFE